MNVSRFQLVDKVQSYRNEPPEIRCSMRVPGADNELFRGHFPGYPLFPGNLMLEFMAQSCGLIMLRRSAGERVSLLMGVDNARFRAPVPPGSVLLCTATLTYENSPVSRYRAALTCDGAAVASAEIRLTQAKPPNDEVRAYMEALAGEVDLFECDAAEAAPGDV